MENDPLEMLKSIVQRYSQLTDRDATNHEFACAIYSADELIAKLDSNYKQAAKKENKRRKS